MNPSQKGWLKEFLDYRKRHFVQSKEMEKAHKGQHPDQSFYGLIQPTGIMYGYPLHFYDLEIHEQWNREDTVKVLLADSFINIAQLYYSRPIQNENDFWSLMYKTMDAVNHFYQGVYPEINISRKNWWGKKREPLRLTERFLEKRVAMINKKLTNFWSEFFLHHQLFLDIYIFGQWSHTQPDQVLLEFFKQEKEDLSYTAVKVMAAAAHANDNLEAAEKRLFEHFIANSSLPAEKRRVAIEYFEHGIGIQDIPVEETDPWVIRKFFLELAILTVWSDKKIEEIEWQFLSNFNTSLGFSEEDFDSSMIAVEGFVLDNWSQLEILQIKKGHHEISKDYIERVSRMAEKYKNRIRAEIKEDKDVRNMMRRSEKLTPAQQEILRDKLIAILKIIPNFRIIALPREFLTYETLIKIIPEDVLSAISAESKAG